MPSGGDAITARPVSQFHLVPKEGGGFEISVVYATGLNPHGRFECATVREVVELVTRLVWRKSA